jgi:hypothetical protein
MKDTYNQVCDFKDNLLQKQVVCVNGALDRFEQLFGIRPETVPVVINSRKLKPWEAATTWIQEESGVRSCFIQLRSLKPPLFYSIEEILSHELVHAVRAHLDEPLFEEILAFRTSTSPFRRFFGPLFSQPFEATLFCATLLLSWVGLLLSILFDAPEYLWVSWTLPVAACLPLLGRLFYHQYLFKRAYRYLNAQHLNPLMTLLHASDAQIKAWARRR